MPNVIDEAWVTLEEVKRHLHIDQEETECDDILKEHINRATKVLEKIVGQQIKEKAYTEYYSGEDCKKLQLNKWPALVVTSIHVDNLRVFGADTLLDPTCYYTDLEVSLVEIFTTPSTGPSHFYTGTKNIKVVYTAGYAVIPEDLVGAACEYVAWMFRRSGTEGTNSQSMGGKSKSYDTDALPAPVRQKIQHYKETNT